HSMDVQMKGMSNKSATANTKADGSLEINATIDTIRYTISEASIRDSLQLDDAIGITMLPNNELSKEGEEVGRVFPKEEFGFDRFRGRRT
ncbi:hypothetical protein Tco_0034537, partial [Tanacetum coccineum]